MREAMMKTEQGKTPSGAGGWRALALLAAAGLALSGCVVYPSSYGYGYGNGGYYAAPAVVAAPVIIGGGWGWGGGRRWR